MAESGRKAEAFYKLSAHPVYMAVATKSGCTFLKNLFYYINNGEPHPLGDQIHQREDQLLRGSEEDIPTIENSPYVFMVVRNPVQRFFSLYFDKFYKLGDEKTEWFREDVGRPIGMNFEPDLTLEEHQKNARLLIDWIDLNLDGRTDRKIDAHWRKQFAFYSVVKKFEPKLLPLEYMNDALPMLLQPEIPNILDAMSAVRTRNKSKKPYTTNEMRHWALTKRIREVYQRDMKLHKRAMINFREMQGEVVDADT